MSDKVYLGDAAERIRVSPAFAPFTKVVAIVGEDDDGKQIAYEAGNDTGRTLTITNPYATQSIVNDILARVRGYSYQPFTASNALMHPAAELGDAITVGGVYSVYASEDIEYGLMSVNEVAATEDEETEDEYPYKSQAVRELERRILGVRTSFIVETGKIEASIRDMNTDLGSRITMTQDKIETEITDRKYADSNLSSRITQTASEIRSEVTEQINSTATTLSSRITQNANSITAEVTRASQAEGTLEGRIKVEADRITSEVTERKAGETDLSSRITQTADSITSEVTARKAGDSELSTRITQTASSIMSEVNGKVDDVTAQSMINQTVQGITLSAVAGENSSTVKITANGIDVSSAVVNFSRIVADEIVANASITSPTIYSPNNKSKVTFDDSSGNTLIMTNQSPGYAPFESFGVHDHFPGYTSIVFAGSDLLSSSIQSGEFEPYGIWRFDRNSYCHLCVAWGRSEPTYTGVTGEVYFVVS